MASAQVTAWRKVLVFIPDKKFFITVHAFAVNSISSAFDFTARRQRAHLLNCADRTKSEKELAGNWLVSNCLLSV
jgi:hypothetical protein